MTKIASRGSCLKEVFISNKKTVLCWRLLDLYEITGNKVDCFKYGAKWNKYLLSIIKERYNACTRRHTLPTLFTWDKRGPNSCRKSIPHQHGARNRVDGSRIGGCWNIGWAVTGNRWAHSCRQQSSTAKRRHYARLARQEQQCAGVCQAILQCEGQAGDQQWDYFQIISLCWSKQLEAKILERINAAHVGVEWSLRPARESVYWPGMNAAIKKVKFIEKCDICGSGRTHRQRRVGIDTICFFSAYYAFHYAVFLLKLC